MMSEQHYLQFDDESIPIPKDEVLPEEFTLERWVKFPSTWDEDCEPPATGWSIRLYKNGESAMVNNATGEAQPLKNEWTHIAVVYDEDESDE